MNKTALAFGIGASLILAAGAANAAGTCGAEVTALQQKLGHEQGANATIGATDPGVQQPSPSASVEGGASVDTGAAAPMDGDQIANSNSGANATIGATDPGVQQPAPEANATTGTTTTTPGTTTGTTTDGSTTTADNNTGANATIGASDPGVQQPDGGGSETLADNSSSSSGATTLPAPTVTETSRAVEMNTAAGGHAEAITALKKAQLAADAGNEESCMTELGTAKAALGIQ